MAAGDDDLNVEIGVVSDPAATARVTNQIAGTLKKSLDKAFAGANPVEKLFSNATRQTQATRRIAESVDDIGEAARRARGGTDELEKDLDSLIRRGQAFRNILSDRGVDADLFSVYEAELEKALRLQRDFQEQRAAIARDPNLRKAFETQARDINQILRTETSTSSRILDDARSRNVVNTQRELTLENTNRRIAGQRQIQDERQRSRARIEIARFTFRQIAFLERQIADAFRGAASLAVSGLRSIQAGAARIGQIFTRSHRDINDGLRGALLRRETSMDRSFSRQTSIVRGELGRQSVIIDKFSAKASTGVAGALTGRSALGGLLGGGLAIGGGFALFQGLRNGIKVGGDFVQGLSVLQAQLQLTEAQMADVRAQSIELGNDISLPGVSALDAAQAIQILAKQFASLGTGALPAAQAAARGVLQLSRAVGVGAEEAARVVGSAVNVFGANADQAVFIADQVTNAMSNAAGVAFNDFADSFTQAASVVNLFIGPTQTATNAIAEFNAGIAVLAKGGLVGSDAGTSLKQFFLQANRGTVDATEVMQELVARIGETGTAFFDAAGNARTMSEAIDILQRGTAGLTDQARTGVLQKLFGSDAARAAAILVNEGAASFEALELRIKRQGAAAEIAAAQNVGLRGALDALNSVIETQQIKTYERYQEVLGRVVLKFAELLNLFFEGVGVLGVVRDALIGAGAGLAALVGFKAAGEGAQFLLLALRAMLTPLGALITAITLVGAALGIFTRRVPEIDAAFKGLLDTVGPALRDGFLRVADGMREVGRAIAIFLAPLLLRLTFFLTESLADGLQFVFNFIANTAIPTIARFAGFVTGTLIPGLVTLADLLIGRIWEGLQLIGSGFESAFRTVQPFIQPAIDGFTQLADAIALLFADNPNQGIATDALPGLSRSAQVELTRLDQTVQAGLLAVGEGMLVSLGRIGRTAGIALLDALQALGPILTDFFEGSSGLAGTALGNLASKITPFLTGPFQEAIGEVGFFIGNLVTDPRLVEALAKIAALAVLTGVNLIKGIAQGIASNAGGLANLLGDVLQAAVIGGFKQALSDPFAFAKIIAVVLLARTVMNAWQKAGEAGGKATIFGFGRGVSRGAVGGFRFVETFVGGPNEIARQAANAGVTARNALSREFQRLNRDLEALGKKRVTISGPGGFVSQADVDLARRRIQTVTNEVGTLAASGAIARARLSNGLQGVKDSLASFAASQGGIGKAIGTTLGIGIMGGVASALAGQQLGSATSTGGVAIGLAGIISSALITGFAIGGAPGAAVGAIVGAIGLATAAFSDNGQAAEIAAGKVSAYADILVKFKDAAGETRGVAEAITETLLDQDASIQTLLRDAGFESEEFARRALDGTATVESTIVSLARSLGASSADLATFQRTIGTLGLSGEELLENLDFRGLSFRPLSRSLQGTGVEIEDLISLVRVLFDEAGAVQGAIAEAATAEAIGPAITEEASAATPVVRDLTNAVEQYHDSLRAPTNPDFAAAVIEGASRAREALETSAASIAAAIESLNEQRTEALQHQIAGVTRELDAARTAADLAFQGILDLFSTEFQSPILAAFDSVISGIPDAVEGELDPISKALQEGGTLQGLDDASTNLRTAAGNILAGIREFAGANFQAGFDTPELLREQFAPLTLQIQNSTLDDRAKRFLLEEINAFLDNPALAAKIQEFQIANSAAIALQAELDALNAELHVKVVFSEQQIRTEAGKLGLLIPTNLFNTSTAASADTAENLPVSPTGLSRLDTEEIARAVVAARTALVAGAADPLERRVVNNTVNQVNNYQIAAQEVPWIPPAEAQRRNRQAASGLTLSLSPFG